MTLQDLSGQTLGQYQLRQLIGTGGMGAVYRGLQANLEREVAIKVLSAALASEPGYVERFYREAKTAASLEHAHIIPVYDYGIQRDISYVVMRLLTGGTLAERLQFRQERELGLPSPGEVADLLRQLAGALDYAHSQGVIHRDIKPSNIMFDNQGNAYLVDFGIAKLLGATSALTGTGVAMGTPAYMPPEQWRSEALTPAADQYALAATVYALLVGHVPYQATTPYGLMHKHFNEMPTPVHSERPELPAAVTLVIERALAKDPGARFPTVTAFAKAFESAIEGQHGEKTGFLTVQLPSRRQELMDMATVSPVPERDAPPPAAPTPKHRPPSSPPPSSEPSMPAIPPARSGRPTYRNPLVWLLAVALAAALAVIALLLNQGNGGEPVASPVGASPTVVAGGVVGASPSHTATVAPTHTASPAPSATQGGALVVLSPTHTPSQTYTPSQTPTLTATVTPSPTPSVTPSLTPSPTRTPSATPSPSPTQRPTATPEPTEVAGPPVVVIGASGSSLREGPDSSFPVIDTVSDAELPVGGVSPDGRWFLVTLDDQQGWIHQSSNTEITGDLVLAPVVEVDIVRPPVVVIGASGSSLREGPDSSFLVIDTVSDAELPVEGVSPDGRWFLVSLGDQQGWIHQSPNTEIRGDLALAPVVEVRPEQSLVIIGGMGAYVREAPDVNAPRLATVTNVELPILGVTEDHSWYVVEWEGREVWIRRSVYVQVEGDLNAVPVIDLEAPAAVLRIGGMGAYVREAPDVNAPRLATVTNVELPILGVTEDHSWYVVEWEGREVWVRRSVYVQVEGDLDAVPVIDLEAPAAVLRIGGMGAYVREAPDVNAPRLATVTNVGLPILGVTEDHSWYVVEWEGREAWVRRSVYVQVEGDLNAVPVIDLEAPAVVLRIGGMGASLREAPDENAPRLATVTNVELPVLGVTEDRAWYVVEWEGREVWVRRSVYVQVEGDLDAVPVVDVKAPPEEPPMLIIGSANSSLRTGPGAGFEVLDEIHDMTLPIKGVSPDRRWFLVAVGPRQGWIHQSSNTEVQGDLDIAPVVEVDAERPVAVIGPSRAVLRAAPAMDAETVAVVDSVRLPVLERTADGRWVAVEWEGRVVWVHKVFIAEIRGNLDAVPVADSTAEAGKAFLDVLLQSDFRGSLDGVLSGGEGWRVRREGDEAFFCVSYSGGRYGEYPAALFDVPLRSHDYLVLVTVRFTSETGHFAILTRLENETGEGYRHALRRNRDGGGSISQYFVGPEEESLGHVPVTVEPDVWYTLRAEVQGEEIRTYLDNRLIAKAPSEARAYGTIAIEGGPDTDVCIGYIVVRSLDQSPDAMRNVPVGVATANLNLRRGPGTDRPVIGNVIDGDVVFVMEKSDDDGWLFVRVERTGQFGWVAAELVAIQ